MLRGSLLVGCTTVILVGSTFGYWFWHGESGVPVTIDRALLVVLVVAYAIRRQWGATEPKPMILRRLGFVCPARRVDFQHLHARLEF